jgi:trigger factor
MNQTTEGKQQFTNNLVTFTVNLKPGSRIEFEVEASPELTKAAYSAALKMVCKKVSISGFRKGRAPEPLVAKNFPTEVDKKWQEEIAMRSLEECQKLSQISPLHRDSKISFNVRGHTKENGAQLSLSFEIEPTVPSVDAKAFTPKEVKRPEVSDAKVDETIRQIRFFYAEWKTISDRPVEEGDLVILDVDVIETNPVQHLFSNTRFEVTDHSMAKWMKELILGKTAGSTHEGISLPDDHLSEEEKAQFQPKKVRVLIKGIEQAILPPLDEAFAQKLGVKTIEDLHTQILKLLNEKADAHVQEELRIQASEFLLNQYPFDLPLTLIERETHFRLKQLIHDPEFQKYWEQMSEPDRKSTVQTIYQQSEKAVRMFYLCRKVLSDAKITISPQDLPPPATTALEILLQTHQAPQMMNEVQQAEAYSRLILEKAEDFVIANANKT